MIQMQNKNILLVTHKKIFEIPPPTSFELLKQGLTM